MAPTHGADPGGNPLKRSYDEVTSSENIEVDLEDEPPYDPRNELSPMSVATSKEWGILSSGMNDIRKLVNDPFKKSVYKDKLTKSMEERASECIVIPDGEAVIVCVSGDQGKGKSALLNSLFSVGNIAREGCSGRSVTISSNIFTAPKLNQEVPFLAEVFFFSFQEIYEILAGYLMTYYNAFNGAKQLAEEASEAGRANHQEEVDEETTDIQRELENVFYSLFRNKDECKSEAAARAFLESARSEDDPMILRTVCSWSTELVQEATGDSSTVTVKASTALDLKMRLGKYTTQANSQADETREPAFWPLVSLISFHFDDPVLKNGLSLLDTPGVSDLVRTRRLSALKHVATRTHALVVCEIARGERDPVVASEVRAMRTLGPDRIVIVATKTDVFPEEEADQILGDKYKVRQLKETVRVENEILAETEEALTSLRRSRGKRDPDEFGRLMDAHDVQQVKVKLAENAVMAYRIEMRNAAVKDEVQQYFKRVEGAQGTTKSSSWFGVSNWNYATHRAGFKRVETPPLSVEQTQIPNLRRKILEFTNDARLQEVLYAQDVTVPGHLKRLLNYISRSPVQRKDDMQFHIREPLEKYEPAIRRIFEMFAKKLSQTVLGPLREEDDSFTARAKKLCQKWCDDFQTAAFLALMNHGGQRRGNKKTKKRAGRPPVDLCAELLLTHTTVVSNLFGHMFSAQNLNAFKADMIETIEHMFSDMVSGLKGDQNFASVDSDDFLESLYAQKPRLRKAVECSVDAIEHRLEDIHRKAAFANADAYITTTMLPIFTKVSLLKFRKGSGIATPGEGWPQHRKREFTYECTRPNGIWADICTAVETAVDELLGEEQDRLTEKIGAIFQSFQEDFDVRCDVRPPSGPEEKELQETLKKNLKLALEHHSGPMQRAADSLRRDFL